MQQSNCIDLRTASGISSVVSDCLFQLLETELSLQVFAESDPNTINQKAVIS